MSSADVHVRPAVGADVEPAFAVSDALSMVLYGRSEGSIEHLRAAWGHGEAWVAEGGGGVVGYATLEDGYVEVWPHPDHRDGDVAAVLLDVVAERGGELETIVPSAAADLVGLYRDRGWVQAREILRMELDVTREPQPPVWPEGVAVRTYRDDDAAAVHALMDEAFAANAEVVLPFDRWLPWMTGDPGFDAGVWFLAEAGADLVGACLCWAEGWVKDVGVRPAWRGRGLGEALLREAFAEFHRRGLATVGLKVDSDNPTGAVRLYERVGMLPDRSYIMFSRPEYPVPGT
jgi:ribosomal protein S18 acetylase RimI-like enzyme